MTTPRLNYIREPKLVFGFNQTAEDPRDGLTLFGPYKAPGQTGLKVGAIGTARGLRLLERWLELIKGRVGTNVMEENRPAFPGFEAAFGIACPTKPVVKVLLDAEELRALYTIGNVHERVYRTSDSITSKIVAASLSQEVVPDIWVIVVPDELKQLCRPNINVPMSMRSPGSVKTTKKQVREIWRSPNLFDEMNEAAAAEVYSYQPDFRRQIKARLLSKMIPTQIVTESILDWEDYNNRKIYGFVTVEKDPEGLRKVSYGDLRKSEIAWNLSTGMFYKLGCLPWKLAEVRPGVCYIGLVFKRDDTHADPKQACCAAQMFLDSGDGVVFRGNLGPWYSTEQGDFHLNREAARMLVETAVEAYRLERGEPPRELFIHGKTWFDAEEWEGFKDGAGGATNVVGVRIKPASTFKLFRHASKYCSLRGLSLRQSDRQALLWSKGYVPRLQTYPGKELPNPLQVDIAQGDAELDLVLSDILGLTKLNYNSCIYGDGVPVTLRFADGIGEILTTAPLEDGQTSPKPFKFYI